MIVDEIKSNFLKAMKNLFDGEDLYLIKNDINERSISHKLAVQLIEYFPNYNIDCEYNGYVKADNERKYIGILKEKAIELGKLREIEKDDEIIYRAVYPDIIVHQRGKNFSGSNILIIEMKKDSSILGHDYDEEKLRIYTSNRNGNELNYRLGAFVLLKINNENPSYKISWYQNGEKLE